jgi:carboxypeptidase C (cathepsin A)
MKSAYRLGLVLLVALCSLFLSQAVPAQEVHTPAQPAAASAETHKDKDAEKETPVTPEKAVATHHELTLGGKLLKYTATAGTLLIRDEEDKPYGSIFYVAYTLDGAEPQTRPVSFLYNGGPGSASLWLHLGSF